MSITISVQYLMYLNFSIHSPSSLLNKNFRQIITDFSHRVNYLYSLHGFYCITHFLNFIGILKITSLCTHSPILYIIAIFVCIEKLINKW